MQAGQHASRTDVQEDVGPLVGQSPDQVDVFHAGRHLCRELVADVVGLRHVAIVHAAQQRDLRRRDRDIRQRPPQRRASSFHQRRMERPRHGQDPRSETLGVQKLGQPADGGLVARCDGLVGGVVVGGKHLPADLPAQPLDRVGTSRGGQHRSLGLRAAHDRAGAEISGAGRRLEIPGAGSQEGRKLTVTVSRHAIGRDACRRQCLKDNRAGRQQGKLRAENVDAQRVPALPGHVGEIGIVQAFQDSVDLPQDGGSRGLRLRQFPQHPRILCPLARKQHGNARPLSRQLVPVNSLVFQENPLGILTNRHSQPALFQQFRRVLDHNRHPMSVGGNEGDSPAVE